MLVLLFWDSFSTVYIIWGYCVFLWELQQYFSPMVLPLVSLEMLKHLCFLLLCILSANFSNGTSPPPLFLLWVEHHQHNMD